MSKEHTVTAHDEGIWAVEDLPAFEEAVRHILSTTNGAGWTVKQVSLSLESTDALRWLRAQELWPKCYWSGRGEQAEVAGVGAADTWSGTNLEALAGLTDRLSRAAREVRYYGGVGFDPAAAAEAAWAPFGAYRLVLPRFELHAGEGRPQLICNLVLPRDTGRAASIQAQIDRLVLSSQNTYAALPRAVSRANRPEKAGWRRAVETALSAIQDGELGKVVLARKALFEFDGALDPVALLTRLQAGTPRCFHFLFQPEAGEAAFVGASPEQLFRQEGQRIWSEAVAGTRPRSLSAPEDEQLRAELLESRKDRREHILVQEHVHERLEELCTTVEVEESPSVMQLAHGQHLWTHLHGTLQPGRTAVDVLRALHPTPAVGGVPTAAAQHFIRRLEPFDRGWYAGAVGWLGAKAAEFAVGIRSGLVQGRTLAAFSGAGIVEGSDPTCEWDEIEQKIQDFAEVLRLRMQPET